MVAILMWQTGPNVRGVDDVECGYSQTQQGTKRPHTCARAAPHTPHEPQPQAAHTHMHTHVEKRRNKNKSTRKAVGEYSSAAAEQSWASFVLSKM